MAWTPKYMLYQYDGLTPVCQIANVVEDNGPQDPIRFTEISGSRGQGSIIVQGANAAWDLKLGFWLIGKNYQDLIAQLDSLQSSIVPNTPYVLKIDRTPTTSVSYNVKRVTPIAWDMSSRFYSQKGTILFRVNSW